MIYCTNEAKAVALVSSKKQTEKQMEGTVNEGK